MSMVRKVPVLAFMLLALTQAASAQVRLGVLGGVTSSNLNVVGVDQPIAVPLPAGGEAFGDFSSRTGFAIGGVAEYYVLPRVALSLQPMYSQQGGTFVFNGPVVNPLSAETTRELSYIDIPLMLKVELGRRNVKPYVTSGFAVGFLTSAKSVSDGQETDIKDDLKSTNYSWSIGGGLVLPTARNTVFLEGRYTLGLTNIHEGPQVQPLTVVSELETKGFHFVVGVTFPLGVR